MTLPVALKSGIKRGASFIGLAMLLQAGCSEPPPPAKVAAPIAPVKTSKAAPLSFPSVKFVDITKSAGVDFVHENGAEGEKLLPETMGSGVAFFDYDSDGDPDLFFVNSDFWPGGKKMTSGKPRPTQKLYQNDGKGHFKDVTEAVGLNKTFYGQGVAVGDFDNDGDPDLYVTALGGGYLFKNEGGKFVDVTNATNARAGEGWQTSAAFFDLENDGDLDLFVCRYVQWSAEYDRGQNFPLLGTGKGRAYGPPNAFGGTFCTLLRNDGGRFTDVSEAAGIQVRTLDLKVPQGKSLGVAPFDIDGDGLVDLAIANDTVPNFLFRNKGNGKFEEMGVPSGVAFDQGGSARGAMGIDWAYFKNDGTLGLAVGNFANEMTALYVSESPASFQFSDLANLYGLGAPTQPPLKFGLFFFDFDNDGRLDLLSANGHIENEISKVQASQTYEQAAQLFWNTGQKGRALYALVPSEVAGPDLFKPIVGRGSAYADIDGDGDLDVVLTANGAAPLLVRNDSATRNKWARLNLVGTKSNRSAIGAKVEVTIAGKSFERQLFPAKGYLSSVEFPIQLGLGQADKVDQVVIKWPSGEVTKLSDVAAGKLYKIVEGKGIEK